jgi:hypothetical protein
MLIGYFSSCPPGYFNLEGNLNADGRRSATFAEGPSGWAGILEAWRKKGGLNGLQLVYEDRM